MEGVILVCFGAMTPGCRGGAICESSSLSLNLTAVWKDPALDEAASVLESCSL